MEPISTIARARLNCGCSFMAACLSLRMDGWMDSAAASTRQEARQLWLHRKQRSTEQEGRDER